MGLSRTIQNGAYKDFPVGGTETILVADDELQVRQYIKFVLEDFGYKVIEAADGDEAVKLYQDNKETVHLLMLDLLMPGKTGRAAYDAIQKIKPGVKVLFLSAYPDSALEDMGLSVKEFSFISKPVSPWDILKKVSEVLGRSPEK